MRLSEIGREGFSAFSTAPAAVLKTSALDSNSSFMRAFLEKTGALLAPHGKTTMSPQLFRRQLDEGAWGITFATVNQLSVGVASGVRRALIANPVVSDADLTGLMALLHRHGDLRVAFLVDSLAQIALIEAWHAKQGDARRLEVLLEIGVQGARTGCRTHDEAVAVARAIHASRAVQLVGIECYEGQGATGDSANDKRYADALMQRVADIAKHCDAQGWYAGDEVIVSAGGSAIFDLVASGMRPALSRPVRGLLRSGCYITHDHGNYKRLVAAVDQRLCESDGLQPAMEVWASVQSCPEPGLAILAVGRRDISFDIEMPIPVAIAPRGELTASATPAGWKVTALNDQHAYLRWAADETGPRVGDRVGLGISHPCTTFDKWHWMPIVDADYAVRDAIAIHF